jgi:hypothetical protein
LVRSRFHPSAVAAPALAALAISALALAPGVGAGAAPAHSGPTVGSIGISLLDAPVSGRNDPRARLYIVDHVKPGTVIHRRISVSNTSITAMHAKVYSGAATIQKGSFIGGNGNAPSELTSWIAVADGAPIIKPQQSVTDTVTIRVPKLASRGERYGVIWAQLTSAPRAGATVTTINRVGIRIYLSVGPGGAPPSAFTITSLTAQRDAHRVPQIIAAVHNTGGRALDISGNLRLTKGPGGLSAGPFAAKLGTTLAPGQSEPVTIPLGTQLPDGPWRATISLTSGFLHESATATIRFPHSTGATITQAQPAAASTSGGGGGRWLIISGIIAALLVAAIVIVGIIRHGADRNPPAPSEATKT